MEDWSMFIQWATNTLLDEPPAPPVVDGQLATFQSLQPLPQASYAALPNSVWHAPTGGSNNLPVTWMNFSAVVPASGDGTMETATTTTTQGLPQPAAYGSLPPPPPMRRAGTGSVSRSSASYAIEHIISERKRREKISQRFVELSAVIPGLKKMDKATILSDATRYVKELQEKLNAREATGMPALADKKTACYAASADKEATGNKPLPEIEAQVCGNNVMIRVLCENGKGVIARVLAEVEDLHLRIVDANAIPSPVCTLNITITAKVEAAFIVTAEDIIVRVSSAFSQHSNCALSCSTKNKNDN